MKATIAILLFLAGTGAATATELDCTYAADGKAVTRRFQTMPDAIDKKPVLFECQYEIGEPKGCLGESYVLVQDDALGVVAVHSNDKATADYRHETEIRRVTFALDRKTGILQLTANWPVEAGIESVPGRCSEKKP